MARKILSIPGLPQLPKEPNWDGEFSSLPKYLAAWVLYHTNLLRVLWAWKRSLDALIEENNTGSGGGHIIQEEGVDLPNQDRLNFIGAAVTAADDPVNGATTVTITTGSQNVFDRVAVSGQSTVVADSTTDTLTLVAGTGITITTDATADSVTISSSSTGLQGKQGPPGRPGRTGPPGIQGPPGPPGEVAFGGVCWLTMIGGGGGGGGTTTTSAAGGGGGSGESCDGFMVYITPGGSYSYSVGAGGGSDTDGGDTTFGDFTCLGGDKGVADTGTSGAGGGARGAVAVSPNSNGQAGTAESACWFGGSSGGSGNTGSGESGKGGGSGGYFTGGLSTSGAGGSGGGGGASVYDKGGSGSRTDGGSAGGYGAGGGGAGGQSGTTPNSGGTGGGGYILLTWLGGSVEFTSGSGTWTAPSS